MGTRLTCPKCQEKLVLHRPAIDSTRVKCRQCGTKFYAGKATSFESAPAGPPNAAETPIDGTQTPMVEAPREHHRRHSAEGDIQFPKWVMPVSLASLILISLAGIFLVQKPPPPKEKTLSVDFHTAEGALPKSARPSLAKTAERRVDPGELARPEALVGTWELQEPGGGSIEFAADGAVQISAPLLDEKTLEFSSRWYAMRQQDFSYDLELGPERARIGNHKLSVTLLDDNRLRLSKYSNSAGLSVRERTFKKRQ